jgi:hypothetical protein
VVHPVGLDDEFLVVHALPGDRHVGRSGLGVLLDQPVVALEEHLQDVIAGPERVQLRPAIEVLERIVRAVVGAPAHEALQVAAVVEVFLKNSRHAGTLSARSCRSSVAHRGGPSTMRIHIRTADDGDVVGLPAIADLHRPGRAALRVTRREMRNEHASPSLT